MAYYFACGSNMDSGRLWERVREKMGSELTADLKALSEAQRALLKGYRLLFTKPAMRDPEREGYADIREDQDAQVEGVIYSLPEEILRRVLDRCEGVPNHYRRFPIEVMLSSGRKIAAITYKAVQCRNGLKPRREYLNHLIRGAQEHRLSAEYIEMLKEVEVLED